MMSHEIRARPASAGKNKRNGKSGYPSWDALMTQVARIIAEDGMYPEEMPDENFEVSGKTGFPAWDAVMTEVARIIAEDGMYPEEMPDEHFEVY